MNLKQLDKYVYISDQLSVKDFTEINFLGIKTVINNRPDHEEEIQPLSADLAAIAGKQNIDYYYLPIASGKYPTIYIEKLLAIFSQIHEPVLMFCRTGNRSVNLWALSQLNNFGYDYVHSKAERVGYNIQIVDK